MRLAAPRALSHPIFGFALTLICLVAAGFAVAPSAVLFRLRLRCGHAQSCNAFCHAVRRCRLSLARTVWAVHAPVHVAVFSTSRGSAALLMLPAAISPCAVMVRFCAFCLLHRAAPPPSFCWLCARLSLCYSSLSSWLLVILVVPPFCFVGLLPAHSSCVCSRLCILVSPSIGCRWSCRVCCFALAAHLLLSLIHI